MVEKGLPKTGGCLGSNTRVLLTRRKESHQAGKEGRIGNEMLFANSVHTAVTQE